MRNKRRSVNKKCAKGDHQCLCSSPEFELINLIGELDRDDAGEETKHPTYNGCLRNVGPVSNLDPAHSLGSLSSILCIYFVA